MKIIKVRFCYLCPWFRKKDYLANKTMLCDANYLLKFTSGVPDVYDGVHSNCPLEDIKENLK